MTGFSSAKGSGKGKDTGKGKGTEPTAAAAAALYSNSSVNYGSPVAPAEFMSYSAGRAPTCGFQQQFQQQQYQQPPYYSTQGYGDAKGLSYGAQVHYDGSYAMNASYTQN